MKKILFITWSISYGYGTEKSLADILNRLSKKYKISILPLFKNANNEIFDKNIQILDSLIDYTKKDFNEKEALENYYKILANPMLFNKLIKEKYDCIVACNHNAPSYFASYIQGTPKVVWVRGDLKELEYKDLNPISVEYTQLKKEHEMQENVFKVFDNIVVISENVKKNLKDIFGITENVSKISNSVDKEKILQLSNEEIKLSNRPTFTIMGRLDNNKNQILLLKSAKIISESRKDFKIYLLGNGENKDKLQKYINDNNLNKNVEILGFKKNPYPYIKNSIATVTTSLSEGFSLVLLESLMLNTPIISTDVGIAKELIEKYNCGTIIDFNEEKLANVLLEYLKESDTDQLNKKFNIGNEYDLDTEYNKTISIIEDTIEKGEKKSKLKKLPYPVEKIEYYNLKDYNIKENLLYILEITKNNVKYEYLINRKIDNEKLIVFNNGAIAGGNIKYPVFQRHSWANELKTSSIFCMDPTLYVNDLSVGWGIGKNDDYYLENNSIILKELIEKMNIRLENTVIYGTSAGGFLSIIMGVYLKGAVVVADNTQLNLNNWIFKSALDVVIMYCFDNIGDSLKYKERFDVIECFKKHNYVPKMYLHVNACSKADNSMQIVPFLEELEETKDIKGYNNIEIIVHYEAEKGHDGLNKGDAISFLYNILEK